MQSGDLIFTDFRNPGRGLAVARLTLSSLNAVVYHDNVFAGMGNGGENAGSYPDTKSDPGISPESYENWLSNLTKE